MKTFLKWLKENNDPSALAGWGEFEDDGATHLIARDKVEDGGKFKDVALYFYRIAEFILKQISELDKSSTNHDTNHDDYKSFSEFPFNPNVEIDIPAEVAKQLYGPDMEADMRYVDSATDFQEGDPYPYDLIIDVLVHRGKELKTASEQLMATISKDFNENQKRRCINDFFRVLNFIKNACGKIQYDRKRPPKQKQLAGKILAYLAQSRLQTLVKDALNNKVN